MSCFCGGKPEVTTIPEEVQVTEVFKDKVLSTITAIWNDEKPEGRFLKARHGFTHFKVDRDDDGGDNNDNDNKGMIVLVHGLGSSLKMYQETTDTLTSKGFVVLRYDFFGHGYSKHDDTPSNGYDKDDAWFQYTPDSFVDQLEDLLDYVCNEEKVEVSAIVGHSMGGVVAISANHRWSQCADGEYDTKTRSVIPKVILVSPAIYAIKPIVAKFVDCVPGFFTGLFKNISFTRSVIGDQFLDANKIAFGKNPETNEYNFPESYKKANDVLLHLFGRVKGVKEHPFYAAAIVASNSYCISGKLLQVHRDRLSQLVQMHSDDTKSKTLFLWGDSDVTVSYEENFEEIRKLEEENKDNLMLETLVGLSHECFWEDAVSVTQAMLPFLLASN